MTSRTASSVELELPVETIDSVNEALKNEKIKCGGGLSLLGDKNWGKINAENEVARLLQLIMDKSNDEALLREAYKGHSFPVKYKAIEGVYKNKKGIESKCWYSIWGKYAGSFVQNKEPPILNFYADYNEEDFDFVPTEKCKFKYNKKTATKHSKTVVVVQE